MKLGKFAMGERFWKMADSPFVSKYEEVNHGQSKI